MMTVRYYCGGFVLEICHQQGGSFKIDHTIATCLNLLQRGRVNMD